MKTTGFRNRVLLWGCGDGGEGGREQEGTTAGRCRHVLIQVAQLQVGLRCGVDIHCFAKLLG